MKTKIKKIIVLLFFTNQLFAQSLDAEKAACGQNTAKVWSYELNRCMNKVDEANYLAASKKCDSIANPDEKKSCQMNLAKSLAGVTDDPNDAAHRLKKGTDTSSVINGAYAITSAIHFVSGNKLSSSCLSLKVLAGFSVAGILSDLLIKKRIKDESKKLAQKYQVDQKATAFATQTKALEYLRDEQETMKSLADLEQKRQSLLMTGYAIAAGLAIYEMVSTPTSTKCL